MRCIFLFSFCVFSIHALAQRIVHDPNVVVRNLDQPFSHIHISGTIDALISHGAAERLAVSANNPSGIQKIISYLQHDTLFISAGAKGGRAYISIVNLNSIKVSGKANIEIAGSLQCDSLSIALSGIAHFSGTVFADKLTVGLSGLSMANISGKMPEVVVNASGKSEWVSPDLVANFMQIDAIGAASCRVGEVKRLMVQASGRSKIYLDVEPEVIEKSLLNGAEVLILYTP